MTRYSFLSHDLDRPVLEPNKISTPPENGYLNLKVFLILISQTMLTTRLLMLFQM